MPASPERRCDTCRSFDPTANECHRKPPVVITHGAVVESHWPATAPTQWCSRWHIAAGGD